jgi:hypothetical protein
MEGMGAGFELMAMNCVWRRDERRVMLARERALFERQRAPVIQHFLMFAVMHV